MKQIFRRQRVFPDFPVKLRKICVNCPLMENFLTRENGCGFSYARSTELKSDLPFVIKSVKTTHRVHIHFHMQFPDLFFSTCIKELPFLYLYITLRRSSAIEILDNENLHTELLGRTISK